MMKLVLGLILWSLVEFSCCVRPWAGAQDPSVRWEVYRSPNWRRRSYNLGNKNPYGQRVRTGVLRKRVKSTTVAFEPSTLSSTTTPPPVTTIRPTPSGTTKKPSSSTRASLKNINDPNSPYALIHKYFVTFDDTNITTTPVPTLPPSLKNEDEFNPNDLGGLDESEVFLVDGSLLVIRGGEFSDNYTAEEPDQPLDDYQAPYREPKLPPPGFDFGFGPGIGPDGIPFPEPPFGFGPFNPYGHLQPEPGRNKSGAYVPPPRGPGGFYPLYPGPPPGFPPPSQGPPSGRPLPYNPFFPPIPPQYLPDNETQPYNPYIPPQQNNGSRPYPEPYVPFYYPDNSTNNENETAPYFPYYDSYYDQDNYTDNFTDSRRDPYDFRNYPLPPLGKPDNYETTKNPFFTTTKYKTVKPKPTKPSSVSRKLRPYTGYNPVRSRISTTEHQFTTPTPPPSYTSWPSVTSSDVTTFRPRNRGAPRPSFRGGQYFSQRRRPQKPRKSHVRVTPIQPKKQRKPVRPTLSTWSYETVAHHPVTTSRTEDDFLLQKYGFLDFGKRIVHKDGRPVKRKTGGRVSPQENRPISLHKDTLVNFKHPLPPINPLSEPVEPYRSSSHNEDDRGKNPIAFEKLQLPPKSPSVEPTTASTSYPRVTTPRHKSERKLWTTQRVERATEPEQGSTVVKVFYRLGNQQGKRPMSYSYSW